MSSTYSFLDVQAAITGPGGGFNLGSGSGSAEEGIDITPTEPLNTMLIGADGQGSHSLHANRSGKIVVRLLKTSPVNGQLAAMLAFQRTSAANHGQNTITVKNPIQGDVVVCQQVAFAKVPDLKYGKEAGVNEWEFEAISISPGLGVN